MDFDTDYERINPATKENSTMEHLELVENKLFAKLSPE